MQKGKQLKGLVYKIERFALNDGPGIRTLVFMKECPLRCLWCSSPQSQKAIPEILHNETNCKKCGRCVETCPIEAIVLSEEKSIQINREVCNSCGQCVEACLNQALESAGYYMTVEELFQSVDKDSSFYRRSNGGVTVGGGEPTMQFEFITEFLKRCKQQYIHTAIETCGYVEWGHFEKLLRYVDLVYIDIKHMNVHAHKELTGVSNAIILKNARRVSAICPMIIRIPIVPGYNDSDENISATARFAAEFENLKKVELLPYHKLGIQTYGQLDREYKLKAVEPPSESHMEKLKKLAESCGVEVRIGG